ncbi:MAG: alpha/beta hydrolase [Candidatus Binatia bacterium]
MTTQTEGTFAGVGGVPVYWRCLAPRAGAPRGVVLVAHGYAEHLGRYEPLARHLVARGLAVAALDHRGHGRSGGPRGHCESFAEFVADLRTLADLARGAWPDCPHVLLGHSMGGLIAFLYLLQHPETVVAGALSGPAFRVPDAVPRWLRGVALTLGRVAPRLQFSANVDARALARDPTVGEAYLADPLVHRAATAGFYRAFRAAQAAALADAHRLRVPVLVLQGDADRVVDPGGAAAVAERLPDGCELVMLPGYFHELLNEPPSEQAVVLARLEAWFDRFLAR